MQRARARPHEPVGERKPIGGFVFVPVAVLLAAWLLMRSGQLELLDFRVFLAALEVRIRRCELPKRRRPAFEVDELSLLVGGASPASLRASLRKLEEVGLLLWSSRKITTAHLASALTVEEGEKEKLLGAITRVENHRRKLPLPRRLLRYLARSRKPVLMATLLGHLLRCLYYRSGACRSVGRCKASWIAEVFGVDERGVKRARRELVKREILELLPSSQGLLNRWGRKVQVNLEWGEGARPSESPTPSRTPAPGVSTASPATPSPTLSLVGSDLGMEPVSPRVPDAAPLPECPASTIGESPCPLPAADQAPALVDNPGESPEALPPPKGLSTASLPPPCTRDRQLPTGTRDQEPARGGPSGAGRTANVYPFAPGAFSSKGGESTLPLPTLQHVTTADLTNTGRLLALFDQAKATKILQGSEMERLNFAAAAEHALAVGTTNPPGLFASIIRGKRFFLITNADEERARQRLREHLDPPVTDPRVAALLGREKTEAPSPVRDVEMVGSATIEALRRGGKDDPFTILTRKWPDWTRDRWDRAKDAWEDLKRKKGGLVGAMATVSGVA